MNLIIERCQGKTPTSTDWTHLSKIRDIGLRFQTLHVKDGYSRTAPSPALTIVFLNLILAQRNQTTKLNRLEHLSHPIHSDRIIRPRQSINQTIVQASLANNRPRKFIRSTYSKKSGEFVWKSETQKFSRNCNTHIQDLFRRWPSSCCKFSDWRTIGDLLPRELVARQAIGKPSKSILFIWLWLDFENAKLY